MDQQMLQIREWREEEGLDSLTEGDIVRMNMSDSVLDKRFIGLCTGREDDNYKFLSRGFEFYPNGDDIFKWVLSEGGVLSIEIFDGKPDQYIYLFDNSSVVSLDISHPRDSDYDDLRSELARRNYDELMGREFH